MSEIRLNFEQWRALAEESPERIVNQFLSRLQMLSKNELRTWLTATATKQQLLTSLQVVASGETSPLACVPYVLQDMFDIEGMPTRCGAPFSAPFETLLEDSSLLYQKLNSLGACFFSKTQPAEFGVDSQGRNPTYGDCKHQDGEQYACGGGAGSVARSISSGLVPLGFGLDTAGGIRIPAAFHGLFGFRMGNNAYAREGVFPIAPSLESVGWINNCIADLDTTFKVFHHVSKSHSTEAPRGYVITDLTNYISTEIKSGLLGLTRELDIDDDPATGTRLRKLLSQGGTAHHTLVARELYSIHQYWIEEYSDQYDDTLMQYIKEGIICPPAKVDECTQIQEAIRFSLTQFFEEYDYLVLPISPVATPEKSAWSSQLEHDIQQLIAPASLAFLPAIILPFNCVSGRHSAAQIIINPRKLNIVPELLAKLTRYYED
ncbi:MULTISPECIES: amidase [unclassified Lentimonas]|uniref:amidase family protein n=1 Tax=unclassified Lentimonas TaxID=2630993 RepID=UPI001389B2D2|nr:MULTISPECIES: amidase [unclassified Lentimonas]